MFHVYPIIYIIELDDGKIYRKALYLMVKTMVSCRFPLNQSNDYRVPTIQGAGFRNHPQQKKQRRTPRFGRGGDGGAASLALKYPEVEVLQVGLGVGVEWIPFGKHTKSYGKWPFIVGFTHL